MMEKIKLISMDKRVASYTRNIYILHLSNGQTVVTKDYKRFMKYNDVEVD